MRLSTGESTIITDNVAKCAEVQTFPVLILKCNRLHSTIIAFDYCEYNDNGVRYGRFSFKSDLLEIIYPILNNIIK